MRGLSVRNREPGVGAPLLAVRRFDPELGVRRCSPATVFLRLPGSLAEVNAGTGSGSLELYSAFGDPTVAIGNAQVPLEIDLTTHVAYVLNQSFVWDLGMMQFLAPAKQVRSQLIPFDSFRPDRIPLVFVHGTFSSPVTWAELNNTLAADPVLRQRYQIWSFMYGSGNALPISAGELRDALTAAVQKLDPARHQCPAAPDGDHWPQPGRSAHQAHRHLHRRPALAGGQRQAFGGDSHDVRISAPGCAACCFWSRCPLSAA